MSKRVPVLAHPEMAQERCQVPPLSTMRELHVALPPPRFLPAHVVRVFQPTEQAQAVVWWGLPVPTQAPAAELLVTAMASRKTPTFPWKQRTSCALSVPQQTSVPAVFLCGVPSASNAPSRSTSAAPLRPAPALLQALASVLFLPGVQVLKLPRGPRLGQARVGVVKAMWMARGRRLGAARLVRDQERAATRLPV